MYDLLIGCMYNMYDLLFYNCKPFNFLIHIHDAIKRSRVKYEYIFYENKELTMANSKHTMAMGILTEFIFLPPACL